MGRSGCSYDKSDRSGTTLKASQIGHSTTNRDIVAKPSKSAQGRLKLDMCGHVRIYRGMGNYISKEDKMGWSVSYQPIDDESLTGTPLGDFDTFPEAIRTLKTH